MPDNRRNLQINQPGIQGNETVDKNGWPTPLTDPSNPLRVKVTNGSNGEQRNFDPVTTSQQRAAGHHAPEGGDLQHKGNDADQGGHGNKLKTSQQNAGDHHTPES